MGVVFDGFVDVAGILCFRKIGVFFIFGTKGNNARKRGEQRKGNQRRFLVCHLRFG